MSIRRVVPNIATSHPEESRSFYTDFLGFRVAMDLGWIVTLQSPGNPTAQISLLPGPAVAPPQTGVTLTIEVDDVEAIFAEAAARGVQVVYPLTTEPWGVRRFHVVDPNGVLINIMSHSR